MNRLSELKVVLTNKFPNAKVNSCSGYGNYLHIYRDKIYCDHVSNGLFGGFYIDNGDYKTIENLYNAVVNGFKNKLL